MKKLLTFPSIMVENPLKVPVMPPSLKSSKSKTHNTALFPGKVHQSLWYTKFLWERRAWGMKVLDFPILFN